MASIACETSGSEGSAFAVPLTSDSIPGILLFNGAGASPEDVAAVEKILEDSRLYYSTANSSQLNAMSAERLGSYRLLIVPGGNFVTLGKKLKSSTTANIREAIQNGLSYLGICAGAFFAGASPYNGLNLTSGVKFGFYADENRGIRKAAVAVAVAQSPTLDQYWEDGPELSGWGFVVGKYPDGAPAIVEGMSGKGWVILSGVHPEAPESWRNGLSFSTPATADHAYAATLINAALKKTWLPHF